jgi:hypothetical protein
MIAGGNVCRRCGCDDGFGNSVMWMMGDEVSDEKRAISWLYIYPLNGQDAFPGYPRASKHSAQIEIETSRFNPCPVRTADRIGVALCRFAPFRVLEQGVEIHQTRIVLNLEQKLCWPRFQDAKLSFPQLPNWGPEETNRLKLIRLDTMETIRDDFRFAHALLYITCPERKCFQGGE